MQNELQGLERVQKIALRIIYQDSYISYSNALQLSNLLSIQDRYKKLLYKFAVKCVKNENTQDIFPIRPGFDKGRKKEMFSVPMARKEQYQPWQEFSINSQSKFNTQTIVCSLTILLK